MFITLEAGGSRPPTDAEKIQIRAALDCATVLTRLSYVFGDSPVALAGNDLMVFVSAAAGNVEIRLPLLTAAMQNVIIKRTDTSVNTVTVIPHATNVGSILDGAANLLLPARAGVTIRSNTTAWWVTDFTIDNSVALTP